MPRRPPPPVDVPPLEGWMTLDEAAEQLGVTRQRAFMMIRERKFRTVRRIGRSRPTYVIREEEVATIRAERAQAAPTGLFGQ